jgi:hypothetical protein
MSPRKRPADCSTRTRSRTSLARASKSSTAMPYFCSKAFVTVLSEALPIEAV